MKYTTYGSLLPAVVHSIIYNVQSISCLKEGMKLLITKGKKIILIMIMGILFSMVWNFSLLSKADAWSGTLQRGMSGYEVTELQRKLTDLLYNPGAIDGYFGYQTEQAVKSFQQIHGLWIDGKAGWQTLNEIDGTVSRYSKPSRPKNVSRGGNISRQDLYLLGQAIHAEARGETYEGQVAVGAVILNRLKSNQFPKSIYGIIYQPRQFDAVYDGQINMAPSQSAINAAQDALNGWDPSLGALYYYNPRYIKDNWILSRPITRYIGSHVFAR